LNDRFLGFSGVLASYVGMLLLVLLSHFNYFNSNGQNCSYWAILIMVCIPFLSPAGLGSMLVHLFGILFGIILAAGFYPKD
jgi:membrane associated rhomboid family serine protease